MTPQQIADQLDAEHLAAFAPVSLFDAPTFGPSDIAQICKVNRNSVTNHARKIHGFPAAIEPKGWFLTWKRSQWPIVLLTFLRACPKARRNLAEALGLSVVETTAEKLVFEVLGNPVKVGAAPA